MLTNEKTNDKVTKIWDNLTSSEKEVFLKKATYLVDRQYVSDISVDELAERIFASGEKK